MSVLPPLVLGQYGGRYDDFPDVQPFSIRSGATYDSILEAMRTWIRDDLTPWLTENNAQSTWDRNAAELTLEVNQALDDAVNQVINASIPVSSALMWAVLQATGVFVVEKFGAVGDGVADDRAAIQAAIDAAGARYSTTGVRQQVLFGSRRYLLGAVDYLKADGSTFGATSLKLPSGVELIGHGILKVKGGAYGSGAFYRIISSNSDGVSDVKIRELTFDANLGALPASTQCNNIDMVVAGDVDVEATKHLTANGNAIRLVGRDGTALAKNTRITKNRVLSARGIGIQVSLFDGTIIADNVIVGTADNGIDVYGENGPGNIPAGKNFSITRNVVRSVGGVGIFPETVMQGVVGDNVIDICGQPGIWVNRINGMPSGIDVHDNVISNVPRGIQVLGDMEAITVHHNTVSSASQTCVQLGEGGNVSGVIVEHNTLNGADGTVRRITVAGAQASKLHTRKNRSKFSDGFTDVVDLAATSVGNIYENVQGAAGYRKTDVASGGTLEFDVPANTAGKLAIYAESGGAWQSMWQGAYVCTDTKLVLTNALTANATPGNALPTVTTNGGRTAQVTVAATGSQVAVRWTLERI